MSIPQSNSTYAIESPMALEVRTRRTPGIPFTADSRGKLTYCSTSSAASPGASVITTTVGTFSSGNTSTGARGRRQAARASTQVADILIDVPSGASAFAPAPQNSTQSPRAPDPTRLLAPPFSFPSS